MKLEFEVFKEAWPFLVSRTYTRKPQLLNERPTHRKTDITSLQFVDLNKEVKAGDLIRLLRALTTNDINESAYFEVDGKLYRMQLRVVESESS
jgi:hypothetical protein